VVVADQQHQEDQEVGLLELVVVVEVQQEIVAEVLELQTLVVAEVELEEIYLVNLADQV
jgi:hypothetical protein